VSETSEELRRKVRQSFGDQVFDAMGKIDRLKLGEQVFSDKNKRQKLNQITHPIIFKTLFWRIVTLRLQKKQSAICVDAPLLFESKLLEYLCYPIIVVYTDNEETQVQRIKKRNGFTEEEAVKRIKSQMPIS